MEVKTIATYTTTRGREWEWRKCTTDKGYISYIIYPTDTAFDANGLRKEYTYWQNAWKAWNKILKQ